MSKTKYTVTTFYLTAATNQNKMNTLLFTPFLKTVQYPWVWLHIYFKCSIIIRTVTFVLSSQSAVSPLWREMMYIHHSFSLIPLIKSFLSSQTEEEVDDLMHDHFWPISELWPELKAQMKSGVKSNQEKGPITTTRVINSNLHSWRTFMKSPWKSEPNLDSCKLTSESVAAQS